MDGVRHRHLRIDALQSGGHDRTAGRLRRERKECGDELPRRHARHPRDGHGLRVRRQEPDADRLRHRHGADDGDQHDGVLRKERRGHRDGACRTEEKLRRTLRELRELRPARPRHPVHAETLAVYPALEVARRPRKAGLSWGNFLNTKYFMPQVAA